MDLVKVDLILNGLDCANCASKIEKKVSEIEGVEEASVNFLAKKLTVKIHNNNFEESLETIKETIERVEPDVKVTLKNDTESHENLDTEHEDHEDNKKELIKIIAAVIFFALPVIFKIKGNLELVLFLISYLLAGGEVLLKAAKNIIKGQIFDENFLMSLATIGAFAIKQFPEGVAVMLFYQIGEFIQDMAVNRSRKSISSLMNIRPDYANLKKGLDIEKVSPYEVKIGDIILVKPGEKIPLDGTVIEGSSLVDTKALTGESVPREVKENDEVLSGFINNSSVLTIEVTKEFEQSTVKKILDLVQNASSKKAPTENFITKFARVYTPVVVLIAVIIAVLPPLLIKTAAFSDYIYRALIFLVISCPCALVISIPMGFFGGIGGASKKGILIKGSNYLEALNDAEIVVFDKTGTLTKGTFNVTEINSADGFSKETILEYAAYAEAFSNHPIGLSIVKAYHKEIRKEELKNYEEISGHGTKINALNHEILAGNVKLMHRENIKFKEVEEAGTIVHVAVDKKYAGYIVISDEIKEDSRAAISLLKGIGVKKTVMLTGDNKAIGGKVSRELALDEYHAELLPQDKVLKIEELYKKLSSKGKLIFVGDGINDAPVLARADVGIAMGGLGQDAAIEASDVVIMTDEPSKISTAIKIAKRTRRIVWQNIIFSLAVKLIVLGLGAAGAATIWEAVFADVGVTVIAVLNSMRALNVNKL